MSQIIALIVQSLVGFLMAGLYRLQVAKIRVIYMVLMGPRLADHIAVFAVRSFQRMEYFIKSFF